MKKYIVLVLVLICALGFGGCNNKSMNYVIENEPCFTGVVTEIAEDDYITVSVDACEIVDETGVIIVPLDVELSDSMTYFSVGDEVTVYYDGKYKETSPVELTKVFAITLDTPADRTENNNS